MTKKIAIDWDESELRIVVAQCSGDKVEVTDAAVIPIENSNVAETLQAAVSRRGLQSTDALVAIGRGKAELRELQLPPVPDHELPDMVRFQAVRSFASSGDSATVDYLVTNKTDRGVELIAAAVGPDNLTEIHETCETAGLTVRRIALRPLSAAALYLIRHDSLAEGDTVLIDLLAAEAEILVTRDGKVIFVRTVRMPNSDAARPKALAGELRRSLAACGSRESLKRVVIWGLESLHRNDVEMLAEASGCQVDVLDPFSLVELSEEVRSELPEHLGRLAPLVGLIAADESHAERLIDFMNPRRRVEEKPDRIKNGLMIAAPIAAALLVAFFAYRTLQRLDAEIVALKDANAKMQPHIENAVERIEETEKVDKFLDVDVNWLDELRRLANSMPPSDQMILTSITATGDARHGGGTLDVSGSVTDPAVIEQFEESLRDESHRVVGDGSKRLNSKDAYRWTLSEKITVTPESIRNARYQGLSQPQGLAGPGGPAVSKEAPSGQPERNDRENEVIAEPDNPESDNPEPDNPEPDNPEPDNPEPNPDPEESPSESAPETGSEVQA